MRHAKHISWRFCEALRDEQGLSLAEVVAAAAILSIAVIGLLTSLSVGFTGVDWGRRQSTAVTLAEQRAEQARAFAMSTAAGQGFAALTSASFPAESYGSIANHPVYRRTTTIIDAPGGVANTKLIEVAVFYQGQTENGMSGETFVNVSTLVARR